PRSGTSRAAAGPVRTPPPVRARRAGRPRPGHSRRADGLRRGWRPSSKLLEGGETARAGRGGDGVDQADGGGAVGRGDRRVPALVDGGEDVAPLLDVAGEADGGGVCGAGTPSTSQRVISP